MATSKDPSLLLDTPCACTMFDMHLQAYKDGRCRGLWFFLDDHSDARAKTYENWLEGAAASFVKMMTEHPPQKLAEKFATQMRLDGEVRNLMNGKIREGALLEWDDIKKLHELLGKEIAKQEARERKQ